MHERLKLDEFGTVEDGPFEGLSLKPLLAAYRDSAWDWPETIVAIGIDHLFEEPENMHPGEEELEVLKRLAPNEEWSEDDLFFDT